MRHLLVGQPCPIDATPASRRHCEACPEFVSYRSSAGISTIGCEYGQNVVGWLRREMTPRMLSSGEVKPVASARPLRATPRSRTRPAVRNQPRAATYDRRSIRGGRRAENRAGSGHGHSLAAFAAAVGLGILLSALDRQPRRA
ncbi:MAG: hypothetical protein ACJ761_10910 [Chloroflexota bacterium]